MSKVLIVVSQEGFQETEYIEPREILEDAGHSITVASFEKGAGVSHMGLIVRTEIGVKDVKVKDYDAVLFVGGGGMVPKVGDKRFVSLAKSFFDAGKIVSAICIAPMILANAGILKGKKATVHESGVDKFKELANYTKENVVVDGKIITACGPDVAKEFGEALVRELK